MQLSLHNGSACGVTIISNIFLDYYMPRANGEFVKIYLYLLRCLGSGSQELTLDAVADRFRCTETDILRALRYWEEERLLAISGNVSTLTSVDFLEPVLPKGAALSVSGDTGSGESAAASSALREAGCTASSEEKSARKESAREPDAYSGTLSPDRIRKLKENEEVIQLLFIAEQYLGKTLSPSETSRILYFYQELNFSADLLEYLIEYCVSKGSKSIRYMEKVALAWHEAGIHSVSMARKETSAYHKNYFTILKAFGISNRNPVPSEIEVMNHWIQDYGFSMDIITEACSRTVSQTGKVNFRYADGILSRWKEKGVRHLTDIQALDTLHRQAQADKAEQKVRKSSASNKFNNFHQRDYNFEELEKQLLNQ